jgi:hypothetical protein
MAATTVSPASVISSASIVIRLPRLEEAPRVLRESLAAEVGPGVGELAAHDEQDERVKYIGVGAKVALAPSLVDVPDDLDVLLRHRPRSIAR